MPNAIPPAPKPRTVTTLPAGHVIMRNARMYPKYTAHLFNRNPVQPKYPRPPKPAPPEPLAQDAVIVHCVEQHAHTEPREAARAAFARTSWEALYATGRMKPCSVSEFDRDSSDIGDDRKLPYLKDVLVNGMTMAREQDMVMLTNDDTVLHPRLLDELFRRMNGQEAISSGRANFASPDAVKFDLPWRDYASSDFDIGRDLFVFRKPWLRKHWYEIPDFLLGEYEFDLVLAIMIRDSLGVSSSKENIAHETEAELPRGLVLHQVHERRWMMVDASNPAKRHNHKLCKQFYNDHGHLNLL